MHPMQPYINLYVFSYISLCIYASIMHPMHLKKGIIIPMVSYILDLSWIELSLCHKHRFSNLFFFATQCRGP